MLSRIRDVPAPAWDRLFAAEQPIAYPFTRHAFLRALEDHGCVGVQAGWEPLHLVAEAADGALLAAAPLYRKAHSYGEFVFDWSWARASHELNVPYYPKLACAVPFTPCAGPRIAAATPESRTLMAGALRDRVGAAGCSSLHALFLEGPDADALGQAGLTAGHDLQFQWRNRAGRPYDSFADFLSGLTHDRRKKIQRERRRVAETGLRFDVRDGADMSEALWSDVYDLYANTYEERGQPPYLTRDFFLDYGRQPGSPMRVILGLDGARPVAAAITLVAGDRLYGRHWGCAVRYDSLHFETCYYQGIELCIREGLMVFDAGAQGEHKRTRGFEPVVTQSAHWLENPRLRRAVSAYLDRERAAVAAHQDELSRHRSYRRPDAPAPKVAE